MDQVFSKNVRRIIVFQTDDSGTMVPATIYRKKRKRKRQSRGMREVERLVRRLGRANQTAADTYMLRHNLSNQKKRDGWLRDLGKNVYKANRKGTRKLRRLL